MVDEKSVGDESEGSVGMERGRQRRIDVRDKWMQDEELEGEIGEQLAKKNSTVKGRSGGEQEDAELTAQEKQGRERGEY